MTDTTDLLKQLRAAVERGEALEQKAKDGLILTALISLIEQYESFQPALLFYRFGLWFASAFGVLTISFFALLTDQLELIKPP